MKRIFYIVFCFLMIGFASEENQSQTTAEEQILQHNEEKKLKQGFDWEHSVGFFVAYFDDGSLRQGYGILLQGGYFITTAALVFNQQSYPKSIFVKMQDDSAKPLICIANLQLQALDEEKGLALLKTIGFTDDYCNPRPQSFYHQRIFDFYFLNLFAKPIELFQNAKKDEMIKKDFFFPLIKDEYSFSINKISSLTKLFYYDINLKQDIFYALDSDELLEYKMVLGTPFFDAQEKFIGILSVTPHHNKAVIIDDSIVRSFLCNLQADFELATWQQKDCRIFQKNILTNIKKVIKDDKEK